MITLYTIPMEKRIIGRGCGFYVLSLTMLSLMTIQIFSFIALIQTRNIIFLLGILYFIFIIIYLIKKIIHTQITYTSERIKFMPSKKVFKLNEIQSFTIAPLHYYYDQAKLNNDSYLLRSINKIKKQKHNGFPLWFSQRLQPYLYIIDNNNKRFLYNLDPFTKKQILKFVEFVEGCGISTEFKNDLLK